MDTPTDLDALKEQLDSLLEDRVGGNGRNEDMVAPVTENLPKTEARANPSVKLEERPAPTPEKLLATTLVVDEVTPAVVEAPKSKEDDDLRIMRKAMDRIAGPFIVYSDDYRVIFANQMARELWPETIN